MRRHLFTFFGSAAVVLAALLLGTTRAEAHGGGHGGGHGGFGGFHGGGFHAGGFHHGGFGGFHPGLGGFRVGGIHPGIAGGFRNFGALNAYRGLGAFRGLAGGRYLPYGRFGYGGGLGLYRNYYGGLGRLGGIGFYRPYYGGFGFGAGLLGFGLGYALGNRYGYGGYGGYGYGGYGGYNNYYSSYPYVVNNYVTPVSTGVQDTQQTPDNSAHLKLTVPADAQVWFDGAKTSQAGTEREYVSPALTPGKTYTYDSRVVWPDANGKMHDETRAIRVHANDWWTIDFTKPAPPEESAPPENPPPAPKAPGAVPPAEAK